MDVHHALLPGQLPGTGLPLGGERTHQLHLPAEGLDPGQLHRVGVGGHDDDRAHTQLFGGAGHALGVVPGGGAHQAVEALLGGESEGLVHGAANFERAHDLEPLELQIDLAAQGGVQSGDAQQGGAHHIGGDAGLGVLHVLQRDHSKFLLSVDKKARCGKRGPAARVRRSYFLGLKLSFRDTARLKTRAPGLESLESAQK